MTRQRAFLQGAAARGEGGRVGSGRRRGRGADVTVQGWARRAVPLRERQRSELLGDPVHAVPLQEQQCTNVPLQEQQCLSAFGGSIEAMPIRSLSILIQ